MDNNIQKLINELAESDLSLEYIADEVAARREDLDKKYAHEMWLEEVADAREDFIESFLCYVETLFGEDESFVMESEDEKYMRERIMEMEEALLDQKDHFDKIAKTIEDRCKEMERESECKCNKSKNEGGKPDDVLIDDWLKLFGLK